jgi:hypothetical protein
LRICGSRSLSSDSRRSCSPIAASTRGTCRRCARASTPQIPGGDRPTQASINYRSPGVDRLTQSEHQFAGPGGR